MVSRCVGGSGPRIVDHVSDSFGCSTEILGGFHKTHGQREVKTDERLGVAGSGGNNEGEARYIFGSEPYPHVGVAEVHF